MRVLLVAARIDRGTVGVSRERIDKELTELGFDGFYETSAADRIGIVGLDAAIRAAVAWDKLPLVTSTRLFEQISTFLLHRRDLDRVMATQYDLLADFREHHADLVLQAEFETCVVLMQNNRLVRRLSFGDLVLLRPEKLDAYASSIVTAARNEPDGLGFITEEAVLSAGFPLPPLERVTPHQQERLLLSATAEELLHYEIAFKEVTEEGVAFVFPAQFTRERPEAPTVAPAVVYTFQGSPLSIYTTLAVRLSRSVAFGKSQMWRGAAASARPRAAHAASC